MEEERLLREWELENLHGEGKKFNRQFGRRVGSVLGWGWGVC